MTSVLNGNRVLYIYWTLKWRKISTQNKLMYWFALSDNQHLSGYSLAPGARLETTPWDTARTSLVVKYVNRRVTNLEINLEKCHKVMSLLFNGEDILSDLNWTFTGLPTNQQNMLSSMQRLLDAETWMRQNRFRKPKMPYPLKEYATWQNKTQWAVDRYQRISHDWNNRK